MTSLYIRCISGKSGRLLKSQREWNVEKNQECPSFFSNTQISFPVIFLLWRHCVYMAYPRYLRGCCKDKEGSMPRKLTLLLNYLKYQNIISDVKIWGITKLPHTEHKNRAPTLPFLIRATTIHIIWRPDRTRGLRWTIEWPQPLWPENLRKNFYLLLQQFFEL